MSKKILFVQLAYNEILNDSDFAKMSLEEKGAYFHIILFLFSENGPMKMENLWRAIGCHDEKHFDTIWNGIGQKFKIKNGKISHRLVTNAIRRIKNIRQAQKKAGLKGARKRWQSHNSVNGKNMPNENVNEIEKVNV